MANQELNLIYTLTNSANATIAVFNDPTDPNYVGMITEISGLDSPEVRESADDLVQADGGIHGDFFYGRRPITITGLILNPTSAAGRNAMMQKLSSASDAMRNDAILSWTPSGGVKQFVSVRRQQPLRFSGAWQKTFQLQVVAADPRVYSDTLHLKAAPDFTNLKNFVTNPGAEGNSIQVAARFVASSTTGTPGSISISGPGRPGSSGGQFVTVSYTGVTSGGQVRISTEQYAGVVAGERIYASGWVHSITAATSLGVQVEFFTSGGASVSTAVVATQTAPTLNTWYQLRGAVTVPATATKMRLTGYAVPTTTGAQDLGLDDLMLVDHATFAGNYFDGDQLGSRWSGTQYASSSLIDAVSYITNAGSTPVFATIAVSGTVVTNPLLANFTNSQYIGLSGVGVSGILAFDMLNKTVIDSTGSTNKYQYVIFPGSQWWQVMPGANEIRLEGSATTFPFFTIQWRDAWI